MLPPQKEGHNQKVKFFLAVTFFFFFFFFGMRLSRLDGLVVFGLVVVVYV